MYAPMFVFWFLLGVLVTALYPAHFALFLAGFVLIRLWRCFGSY